MELVLEAELYSPSIDEERNYVDRMPPTIAHGIRCPCGSRRDKVYNTSQVFQHHIKTKHHQDWLRDLNLNKVNHYRENEELKRIVQTQKMIISKLEKKNKNQLALIGHLSQKQMETEQQMNMANINLIDMDI